MAFYDEDGNWMPQELETYEDAVVCQHCGKRYKRIREEQVIGFRERSEDYCPYCGESNGSSMDWDFYNSKIDEE